jgi:hypothetical protein
MGRIPYLETPQQALQLIRPRHREIMRRLVCGQTQRDIASELGLTESRLSIIVNSPLFKVELAKMERDVRTKAVENIGDVGARVAKLQSPAIDVLETIVKEKAGKIPYTLKRAAAMDILELAGTKKNKNDDGMNDFAQFISEAFAEAKARAFDRLNRDLEEESTQKRITEGTGVDDFSSGALPLDEAEDLALASFTDIEAKEVGEDTSSVLPPINGDGHEQADASPTDTPPSQLDSLSQLLKKTMEEDGLDAAKIHELLFK